MRSVRIIAAHLAAFSLLASFSRAGETPRIRISYPPGGTETNVPRIRIAGSCDPACRVSVRGKPVKVYPTGGFVDLVELEEGKNLITVVAENAGRRAEKTITVNCVDPRVTSPRSPLTIDVAMMRPAEDTVLQPGDTLEVRVKGSPGAKAFWDLGGVVRGSRLKEAKPAKEGALKGVRGIYRGTYWVKRGDSVEGARVRFRLESGGRITKALSPGRVTLLPDARLSRGTVGEKGARLRREPGGDMVWKLWPGARVTICGESGGSWRLLLPGGGRYWVSKESVKESPGQGAWEEVEAGTPVASRAANGARIVIPLAGAPPVRVTQPRGNELDMEMFGVRCPRKPVRAAVVPPVERVEISRRKGGGCVARLFLGGRRLRGYRCGYGKGGIVCVVKDAPARDMKGLTIVVDPGHGGAQPGAVSVTGVPEKKFNLDIAHALAAFLRGRGARVRMTREGDSTLSLSERIEIARREGANLFVSVHNNSRPGFSHPLSRRGADLFFGVRQSEYLAKSIEKRLAQLGVQTNGCHERNFAVILPTDYPAVLVECGYLSHPEDEGELLKGDFRARLGRAIGEGVVDFALQ